MVKQRKRSSRYKTYIGDAESDIPRETKRRRRRLLDLDSQAQTHAPQTDGVESTNDEVNEFDCTAHTLSLESQPVCIEIESLPI